MDQPASSSTPGTIPEGLADQPSSSSAPGSTERIEVPITVQEHLPFTEITHIMRRSMHTNGDIEQGAVEYMQECLSEFIFYITMEASTKCLMEGRRVVTADDVAAAMRFLKFDYYCHLSSRCMERYRESRATVGLQCADLMGQETRAMQTAVQEMHGGSENPSPATLSPQPADLMGQETRGPQPADLMGQETRGPQAADLMGQGTRCQQTADQEMHGASENLNGQLSSSGAENAMQE